MSYLKKHEISQRNNVILHLKNQGKKEKTRPKVSESKEIVNITGEINEIETKISLENLHENKT